MLRSNSPSGKKRRPSGGIKCLRNFRRSGVRNRGGQNKPGIKQSGRKNGKKVAS